MAIKYYPNRVYRAKVPAIDRVMAKREPVTAQGAQNVASTAVDVVISNDDNWMVSSVAWQFSNANPRNFGAAIMGGRKIVENLNDYLWFDTSVAGEQRIILTPGFYTGTELATHLRAMLNANTIYNALGLTFTVTYVPATGVYTIAPSAGTIRYLETNNARQLTLKDSIAGHLFGFTVTTPTAAASIMSDTNVYSLNTEVAFVTQTANANTVYYHIDIHIMTIDQALHLTSNSGPDVTLTYVVNYEELV